MHINSKNYIKFLVSSLFILMLLGNIVSAKMLDQSSNLVCSAIDIIGCTTGLKCSEGNAQTFDLPNFMFINFAKKLVHAKDKNGDDYASPIKSFEVTKEQLIIQGIENHRGWSAAINRKTGDMSISSVGDNVSIVIFGACTAI
jgi:hypothetical protein